MDFDLISSYYVRIFLKAESKAVSVECRGQGYYKAVKCEEGDLAVVLVITSNPPVPATFVSLERLAKISNDSDNP